MNKVSRYQGTDLDKREPMALSKAYDEADFVLMKKYQYELINYPVIAPNEEIKSLEISKHTRLLKIESIAYNKDEDNLIRLSNVYNALSAVKGSVVVILDSNGEKVDFYIGTKTEEEKDIHVAYKTLEKSLQGNFPGCVVKNQMSSKIKGVLENVFIFKDDNSAELHRVVSAVNGVSSVREINLNGKKKEFAQGIEKLIDSMRGEVYSVVLIADSVDQKQIDVIRSGYEQLYTKIVPFASAEMTLGYSEGQSLTDSITKGTANTISESLTHSQSHSHTTSTSTTNTVGGGASINFASANYSHSETTTEADTYTDGKAETKGTSTSKSLNVGISNAISMGESRTLQFRTEDKSVINLLERIDEQLKRLNECGDLGMWNCAAYFIADDEQISKTAASAYQALIRGENSGIEAITINTWKYDENNKLENENYYNFVEYIKKLNHPKIDIGGSMQFVTPTSLISGSELTLQAGLPQKSVPGLAVSEYAAFGREVMRRNDELSTKINIGHIYHMGLDEKTIVDIDCQSLASHTFITGSTGSGKSNTIYNILYDLSEKEINYLIIEPAKGEYKNVFGNKKGVEVLGTNPMYSKLLRINPFKFPEGVHVLEHVDRLVEIFNVCWPLYAAMPAVLKDAVLTAYEVSGWDLLISKNKYSNDLFPTFHDLLIQLDNVIESSGYSQELKSNYKGALSIRIKTLTNGLNGQIFSANETDNILLFDKNVIIDLCRVGSMETKSLIMGILIMRLSEHRMTFTKGMNLPLKHVTVLEEAHNILKRTSGEQNSDGSNISNKSVEMLSNAIAEMRTLGEGFIIADQSPNAVDISAIRNTSTKIILRLPDEIDRRLAVKSAALKDEQLDEIAKLPKAVAVVYQNDWLEPVLCKVNKFEGKVDNYEFDTRKIEDENIENAFRTELLKLLLKGRVNEFVEPDLESLNKMLNVVDISTKNKIAIRKVIDEYLLYHYLKIWEDTQFAQLSEVVSELVEGRRILENAINTSASFEKFDSLLNNYLDTITVNLSTEIRLSVVQCLLKNISKESLDKAEIYSAWVTCVRKGEILNDRINDSCRNNN